MSHEELVPPPITRDAVAELRTKHGVSLFEAKTRLSKVRRGQWLQILEDALVRYDGCSPAVLNAVLSSLVKYLAEQNGRDHE